MALTIGSQAPSFNLIATDGNTYSYGSIKGENATVIIWWCNHCPYVIPNQERVIALQKEYKEKGVNFAVVCSNNPATHPDDSFANMSRRAIEMGYNFPYLHDESQEVAKAFGAQRTPEAFLFDAEEILCYHGRIDDNYQNADQALSHDLRNAIEAVLAGNIPDPSETGAVGCTIKWK